MERFQVERTELMKLYIVLLVLILFAPIVLYSNLSGGAPALSPAKLQLPENLGNWNKVRNIPFQDRIIAILGTKDVLGGVYENSEKNIIKIVIVQAVNNRSAFHPPEYCLTGAGSEIVEKRIKVINGIPEINGGFSVNEMVFKASDKSNLLVWNWYSVEKSMTPNYYSQQWKLVTDRLRHGDTRGAVVNMYTNIYESDVAAADNLNADFLKALVPFLSSNL
jgi:EpsI family protein